MPSLMLPNFIPAIPEIFVLFMALMVLMIGILIKKSCKISYYLTQITLIAVAGLTWYVFSYFSAITFTFHHMFVLDYLSMNLKLFIYVLIFLFFFTLANIIENITFLILNFMFLACFRC